ncbi:MAG: protein translocase subunit SecD [Ruminococcaceae bacterium]|nr:protein translocase subunit SecD [Oscillospiraceae bacterium]
MKSKSIAKFSIVVLIIAVLAYVASCGLVIGDWGIPSALDPENGIKRGLDLAGGSIIVFEAQAEEVTEGDMNAVVQVLRNRLDSQGYYEAIVSKQGDKRVRVEIPSIENPEEAVAMLGATAKLEFKDAEGNVVLTGGEDVKAASAIVEPIDETGRKGSVVKLELTDAGRKKFSDATQKIAALPEGQNIIAISLDDVTISAPRVLEHIDSAECRITGEFTNDEAKTLAAQIQSGQLPFTLKDVELRSVGPQLGEKALENSLLAGGIGLLLVMIFMLLFYRMCGFVADIALVGYVSIVAIILALLRVNLTLPGIAGIILTIGTAVDANVIIFERVKEELALGKTLRASIEAGFNRAFSAILDANVTTIIAAAVLYFFGTGTIKGFAVTLFIGTIVSMFTAIVITRFLLRQMVGFDVKNPKLYCAVAKEAK